MLKTHEVDIKDGKLKIENEPISIPVLNARWMYKQKQSTQNANSTPLLGKIKHSDLKITIKVANEDNESLELIQRYFGEDKKVEIGLSGDEDNVLEGTLTPDKNPVVTPLGQHCYITIQGWFNSLLEVK